MLFRSLHLTVLGLAAVLLVAGCGEDAEPAAAPPTSSIDPSNPFGNIPRDQLYGASPLENLWSPRIELEATDLPPGWDGARFAIISDFHIGKWSGNQEVAAAAVQKAVDSAADVTFLLGNYVESEGELPALEAVLAPLRGKRTIAVLGDRDIQSDSLQARVTRVLQAAGVIVLQNNSVGLELGGDTAWVAGVDPNLVSESLEQQRYLLATLSPAGRTPILLTHYPALATREPIGRYPVTIGGHTFCGTVEVPGSSRLSWLATEGFPGGAVEGVDRLFRVQGGTVVVTCGIGYGYVPVRFGAPPEVPILTLRRAGPDLPVNPSNPAADSVNQRLGGLQPGSPR